MQELLNKIASAIEEGFIHKEAWAQLYNAFGERGQTEEMALMDNVLNATRLENKERLDALQDKTASKV